MFSIYTNQKQKMKKIFYLLSFLAISAFATSCEKAAAFLLPIEMPLDFSVSISQVVPGIQSTLGTSVVNYNLETEIRSKTSGELGADFIKQILVKDINIKLTNADATNNLGNFESLSFSFNNNGGAPVVIGPFAIPATANAQHTIQVTNSPNIRQFFTGNNVTFNISGKARSGTNKTLNADASATMIFDK